MVEVLRLVQMMLSFTRSGFAPSAMGYPHCPPPDRKAAAAGRFATEAGETSSFGLHPLGGGGLSVHLQIPLAAGGSYGVGVLRFLLVALSFLFPFLQL